MQRRTFLQMLPLAATGMLLGTSACSSSDEGSHATASPGGLSTSASSEETYKVKTEELSFQSDGNRIYGKIRIPEATGQRPVAIMSHGFGGNHDQESHMQDILAQHGIVVFSYDFSGGSGYVPGQSEGDMTDMSVFTEVQNLRDALKEVEKLTYVDSRRIYLIGASQGGVVTTLVANQHPAGVQGIVLLYPAFSLFDDAHKRFPTEADIPNTYDLMGLTVGRRYFTDIYNVDIYKHMSKFSGNVLIFHGAADELVPISYSERAAKTFTTATLKPIDGEGHGFSYQTQEIVADATLKMINS
jgi:hypothetical protein